jgi:hypothetical protein
MTVAQQLAHRAFVQLDSKFLPDPLLQIGAPPAYYAIPLKIRASSTHFAICACCSSDSRGSGPLRRGRLYNPSSREIGEANARAPHFAMA